MPLYRGHGSRGDRRTWPAIPVSPVRPPTPPPAGRRRPPPTCRHHHGRQSALGPAARPGDTEPRPQVRGEHAEEVLGWCEKAGIRHVTVFVCSAENLTCRDSAEVAYLMRVIEEFVAIKLAQEPRWQVHVAGNLDVLPDKHRSRAQAGRGGEPGLHDGLARDPRDRLRRPPGGRRGFPVSAVRARRTRNHAARARRDHYRGGHCPAPVYRRPARPGPGYPHPADSPPISARSGWAGAEDGRDVGAGSRATGGRARPRGKSRP